MKQIAPTSVAISFRSRFTLEDYPFFPEMGTAINGTDVVIATRLSDPYLRETGFSREQIEGFIRVVVTVDSFEWNRDTSILGWQLVTRRSILKASDEGVLQVSQVSDG